MQNQKNKQKQSKQKIKDFDFINDKQHQRKEIQTIDELKQNVESAKSINPNVLFIFHFYATWCPPCKNVSPFVEDLSGSLDPEEAVLFFLDIDKHQELSNEI